MAERPVECSHCKKPIKVLYKEIIGDSILCTEMCADCPILQARLHGDPHTAKGGLAAEEMGLCCGHCRTSLESVKMGNPVGCSTCYEVFADVLISDLLLGNKISPRLEKALAAKKTQPLHLGKSPNKPAMIPSSSRLATLHEALNDALKRENYEQAAWLRDQIKAITEGNEGKS